MNPVYLVLELGGGDVEAGAVSVSSVLLHLRAGVKRHFLADLATRAPATASQLAELYGTGAYAAKTESSRVGRLVQAAVRAAGGCPAAGYDPAHLVGRGRARSEVTQNIRRPAAAEQLALGI